MEEQRLIKGCKSGQAYAFDQLISIYEEGLYKYCYYLAKKPEDAKDIYQETWYKAISRIEQYDDAFSFKNWLYKICSNTYRDHYRKWKRLTSWQVQVEDEQMTKYADQVNVEDQFILSEDEEKLKKAINALKEHYKLVIVLFYFQDRSLSEISNILQVPVGTVKSRLNQSKKLLKKEMEVM